MYTGFNNYVNGWWVMGAKFLTAQEQLQLDRRKTGTGFVVLDHNRCLSERSFKWRMDGE